MSGYTIAWIIWALAFAAIEGKALLSRQPGTTLSEHIWRWWHVRDPRPTPLVIAGRIVLLSIMVWLTGHFSFGWWTL